MKLIWEQVKKPTQQHILMETYNYMEKNSLSNFTQLPFKVRTYGQVGNYLVLLQLFVRYQIFKNE